MVISEEGESGRIITAYIPSTEIFEKDLKTRKERQLWHVHILFRQRNKAVEVGIHFPFIGNALLDCRMKEESGSFSSLDEYKNVRGIAWLYNQSGDGKRQLLSMRSRESIPAGRGEAGRLIYDSDKPFCKEGNLLPAELRKRKTAERNPDCV